MLQDDYTSLFNGITLATGIKTASIYKFEECTDQNGVANVGHYLTLQTQLQYENAGGNTSTVGVLKMILMYMQRMYRAIQSLAPQRSNSIIQQVHKR